jgi:hypothetical protein
MTRTTTLGVSLPEQHTGSSFLQGCLAEAVTEFHDVFRDCRAPQSGKAFKRAYADYVTRFEAARVVSPRRVEVARFLADRCIDKMHFSHERGRSPLREHLAGAPRRGDGLTSRVLPAEAGWTPEVPFEGRVYRGAEIKALVSLFKSRHQVSDEAAQGLGWILDHIAAQGDALDLRGHRFAMLGAGAELAPTEFLLRAGASVLWIDLSDPTQSLARRAPLDTLSGALFTAPHGGDLLVDTAAIASSVRRFAEDGPVHLGLFAYAPGQSREIRLAAAMEGIARALPQSALRSIGMYVSPTTPIAVQPCELISAKARAAQQPMWMRALCRSRLLTTPGHKGAVACTTVPLQGPGYLATQYLFKVMMAERWATLEAHPVAVSANVAGITNTQSLEHPLFQIAFRGAKTFGIQVFDTETSRPLSALLWLRDLLDPRAPAAPTRHHDSDCARAEAAMSQHIHGGVFSLPWSFYSVIRNATVIGAAKHPRMLFKR